MWSWSVGMEGRGAETVVARRRDWRELPPTRTGSLSAELASARAKSTERGAEPQT
jgi:hypothetical protein